MRSLIVAALFALGPGVVVASSGDASFMLKAHNNLNSTQSLHRGAKYFVNYCSGCHAAQYVRYERVAEDLGLTEEQVLNNLMFGSDKIQSLMEVAMPPDHADNWFGKLPPDLSLVARSRGVDWIYSYLMSFYVDESSPWGVNNLVLPNASMPHVLWDLQGLQSAHFETHVAADGSETAVFAGFEPLSEGRLSAEEYDRMVTDIVNFLEYIGEPVKLQRQALGIKVIAYLVILLLLAIALKKEYWKDIH